MSVKFDIRIQEVNTMVSHDEPIHKKKRVKTSLKSVRLNRPRQIYQRMGLLMALTAKIYVNIQMTQKVNPNYSSRNLGNVRWLIR